MFNNIYDNLFNNTNNVDSDKYSGLSSFDHYRTRGRDILGGEWVAGYVWSSPHGKAYSETCIDEYEPISVRVQPYFHTTSFGVAFIDKYPLSTGMRNREIAIIIAPETETTPVYETIDLVTTYVTGLLEIHEIDSIVSVLLTVLAVAVFGIITLYLL